MATGPIAGYVLGGRPVHFVPVIAQHNWSREPFHINGICISACTTFLAIRNVCVTRGAIFYFHAGHDRNRNITAPAIYHMLSTDNDRLESYVMVRTIAWIRWRFTPISGRDMIEKFGCRECPKLSRR